MRLTQGPWTRAHPMRFWPADGGPAAVADVLLVLCTMHCAVGVHLTRLHTALALTRCHTRGQIITLTVPPHTHLTHCDADSHQTIKHAYPTCRTHAR